MKHIATKTLAVVLIVAMILLAIAAGAIAIMLGRVKRVSLEEAAIIAQQEQEQRQQDIENGLLDAEDEEPDIENELTLIEEVEQSQLTEEELRAIAETEKRAGAVNVLLIGVDRRGKSGYSRSDTLLIATLDKKNQRLKLTSLMRDMYVPISGNGENRINYACAKGGPGLLMQTINENFSMDLTTYVLVDFDMFDKIVDKLGGVTVEMSEGEVSEANDCIAGLNLQQGRERTSGLITQRSGKIKLTGQQALGYCRIRHFGSGDYARTSRQFKVLRAIYDKFMKVDAGKKLTVLYDVLPYVETNMTDDQIIALATAVISMNVNSSELMHYRLPAEGTYKSAKVKGMQVLLPDIPANTLALHRFIYEATEAEVLPGSDTGKGVYTPKPYYDEEGNLIDPNASPTAAPSESPLPDELPEETSLPEESPLPDELPEETSLPEESPIPTSELPEGGEEILPDLPEETPPPDDEEDGGEVVILP